MFQSDLTDQDCMKIFISESLSAAVLDSAATNTVAGKTWMDCYIDSLPEEKQTKYLIQNLKICLNLVLEIHEIITQS